MEEIKEMLKSLMQMAVNNSKEKADNASEGDKMDEDKKEVENENGRSADAPAHADKRKLIDEVGGILKGKVDDVYNNSFFMSKMDIGVKE